MKKALLPRSTTLVLALVLALCTLLYASWKTVHFIWLSHRETINERQPFQPIMVARWRKLDWREALNVPDRSKKELPWFDTRLPTNNEPPDFPYQRGPIGNSWFASSPYDPGSFLPNSRFKWKRGLAITGPGSEPMIGWHGTLHSHTGWSDGAATPQEAYGFARDRGGLDFFAVTDHPEFWLFNPGRTWDQLKEIAAMANRPDFVALPGFEYSSPIFGHYTVIGSDGVCSAIKCPELSDFYRWLLLPKNRDALVAFAHPLVQRDNAGRFEFAQMGFVPALEKQMFGVEVIHWSGHDRFHFGFSGRQPFIDEAMAQGWHTGALGSQDNHSLNWGLANARIGVLSKNLDRPSLIEALRARRFYATSSRDLEMAFDAKTSTGTWTPMGGIIQIPRPQKTKAKSTDVKLMIETRLRLFEPDQYNAPRRIEWILDGRVISRLDFEGLPHELASTEDTANYYSGEITGAFSERLVSDGERHYLYARMFMGDDFATYAQSSPIIFSGHHSPSKP